MAALLVVAVVFLGGPFFKNFLEHGKASLHQAARYGDLPAVESLIAAGADVNAKTRRGETPLDFAIEEENDAVIPLLEAAGGVASAQ